MYLAGRDGPQAGSIYVAERNGAIVSHSANGNGVTQPPGAGYITSMAYDGAHVTLTWTQMAATWGVDVQASANHFRIATGANPRLAMFNGTGDLFWLDDNGVVTSRWIS